MAHVGVDWLLYLLLIFSTHPQTHGQEENHSTRLAGWRHRRGDQCCHPPVFEHAALENWKDEVYGRVVEASTIP
jgi:hypothetical protein